MDKKQGVYELKTQVNSTKKFCMSISTAKNAAWRGKVYFRIA